MGQDAAPEPIPPLVRAFALGLAVQIVGILPFSWLLSANLSYGASVPWACVVEIVLLWLLCRYLRGSGWPASTASRRRELFRVNRPDVRLLYPVAAATGLLSVSIGLLIVLMFMLVRFPESAGETFLALAAAPPVTAVTLIVTLAVVTGIVEEGAFRGYMQLPLEERYGPVLAVPVVAVAFTVVHWPPLLVVPLFIVGAAGWSILAWLANSTIPGMVAHASVDAIFLLWVWRDPQAFQALLARSVIETGPDPVFWATTVATVLSFAATGVVFVWLGNRRALPSAA